MSTPHIEFRVRYAAVLAAASMWAGLAIWTTELSERDVAAVDVGFWRAAVGGACFLVHALVGRRVSELRALRTPVPAIAFALISVTLFYVALPAAAEEGGIGMAWLLLFTAPVWVALGAAVFLNEALDRQVMLVIFVVVAGVVIVVIGASGGDLRVTAASIIWGVVSGVGYASFTLFSKSLSRTVAPIPLYAAVLMMGALPLVPFVDLVPDDAATALLLVGMGVTSTYLPYLAYGWAITGLRAGRAAAVATLELPLALCFAAFVYGDDIGWVAMGGALVILAGAVMASQPVQRNQSRFQ